MHKLNELEMFGGKATVFSVKVEKTEFPLVTPDLKEVKTVKTGGVTAKTSYVDSEGKEWDKNQLGYAVTVKNADGQPEKKFIQKLCKTQKVLRYEVVEKTDIKGNLVGENHCNYAVTVDKDAEAGLRKLGVYDDKVLTFQYKKVDFGMGMHKAWLYSDCGILRMETLEASTLWSDVAQSMKTQEAEKNLLMAALAEEKSEIIVKAEEIEVII